MGSSQKEGEEMKFIMRWLRKFYLEKSGLERISPNDWVKRDQIDYNKDSKLLTIKLEPEVAIFGVADTGSMDGLVDYGHNVILTDHFDKAKLAVGDIIAYQLYTKLILHRIVEVREDIHGRIYRTRGDNCVDNDPHPVRDIQVKYLCLGIIY